MFTLYRSNRQERLLDALCGVVEEPLSSPMASEWVAVQSSGMGAWLGMEMSLRLPVWSNVRLPFPRGLVEQVFKWVLLDKLPNMKPFELDSLTWSIMGLLPKYLEDEAFLSLRRYLASDEHGKKQYQLAKKIAAVFDEYSVFRPEMVLNWEEKGGDDWQAILFNAIVADVGSVHIASVSKLFFEALRSKKDRPISLPERISLFGISTLPPLFIKILAGLQDLTDVHLFLISPSEKYWADICSKKEAGRRVARQEVSTEETEASLHLSEGNPLLASLGVLGRDFQKVLEENVDYVEPGGSLYEPISSSNMLGVLQSDILTLTKRPQSKAKDVLQKSDNSISIHSCHSPMREVEVLKDQLLRMFDSCPSVMPHNVIVMAPDIDLYAPYIDAVFGARQDKEPEIPYRLSDLSALKQAAVVDAFLAIINMASSRLPLQEVFDLLMLKPVRDHFRFSQDEIEILRTWTMEAGVRFGMDQSHRKEMGQPEFHENTWRFGLDRLLIGYALPGNERHLFKDTLPYDDVEGKEALSLGRFAQFADVLFEQLRAISEPRPISKWCGALKTLLEKMVCLNDKNAHQHKQILDTLTHLEDVATLVCFDVPVGLDVVQDYMVNHLENKSASGGFLLGGVTCCSFLPMRSIPFEVVCLLGLNHDAFPRTLRTPVFDKMAASPRAGDRSMRNDDRYLFLESMLQAKRKLIISYVGQSIKDNSEIPPSVVVSELLDVLEDSFHWGDGEQKDQASDPPKAVREKVVVRHPLQPFSPKYFDAGQNDRLFSYSKRYLEGAKAILESSEPVRDFLTPQSISDEAKQVLNLDDLVRFLKMPCRHLLKNRLGIYLPDDPEMPEFREPIERDSLSEYSIGSLMFEQMLENREADQVFSVLRAKGVLPLGAAGRLRYALLEEQVGELEKTVREYVVGERLQPIEVDLMLGGTRLIGRLDNLWPDARIQYRYATVKAQNRLNLWVHHLVLNCLARPGYPRTSVWIGRDKNRQVGQVTFGPIDGDPRALLLDLVRLYFEGQSELLRFLPEVSFCYAQNLLLAGLDEEGAKLKAKEAVLKMWRDKDRCFESQDPAVGRSFVDGNPILSNDGELDYRFEALAIRVYGPLLEEIGRGEP